MDFLTGTMIGTITLFLDMTPYWLPVALGFIFWKLWIHYIQAKHIAKIEWIVLEVRLPRDVFKPPLAMELVLNALYQTGGAATWVDRIWLGKVRTWFSLEMVSLGGTLRFFIRAPKFFKNLVESQIYAQYAQAEVNEVPDYTDHISFDDTLGKKPEWSMWGCEFKLSKPDPYPIKTYVDYGLDRGDKEEYKVDPLTSTMELLGSIGPDEQLWIQILVQATKKRFDKPGTWTGKRDWKDEGVDLIAKLREDAKKKGSVGDEEGTTFTAMTKGEMNVISAIERSVSKLGFDCGVRGIYLAKKEVFNAINIVGLVGAFKQYGSADLNGFRPSWVTSFDYPWEDFRGIRASKKRIKMLSAYKMRSFFYPPFKRKPFVLNTEELATIYHFPGGVAETPSFARIESKKTEPPVNLPI